MDRMIGILKWAQERPLFTLNDLQRELDHDRSYLRLMLHRMVDKRELIRVARGKYTVHRDPMIYATYIETPSFFSYWTALRYHNLTTQEPSRLQVVTRKNRPDLEMIEFHSSSRIFGYERRPYRDHHIFVADKERLLLDCLGAGIVPIEELAELVREIDEAKVVLYCGEFQSRSLAKRAGYLLENAGKQAGRLQDQVDHNYVPLDLSKRAEGKRNSRWKIVVNADVA